MAQIETEQAGLPVALDTQRPKPSLVRSETTAAFVSQLIAARAHLPVQRERRRETPQGAVGAYASGAKVAIKRMPMGYRTTVVA